MSFHKSLNTLSVYNNVSNRWVELFYEPRRWRIKLEKISECQIELINASKNCFDFMLYVETFDNDFFEFYEAIIIKKETSKEERILGELKINDHEKLFIIDRFSSTEGIFNLLKTAEKKEKNGKFSVFLTKEITKALDKLEVLSVSPLFPKGEPTTNRLYVVKIIPLKSKDLLVKRYLPRERFYRGNNEFEALKTFKKTGFTPKLFGGIKLRKTKNQEQILALFMENVKESKELGEIIWKTIYKRCSKEELQPQQQPILETLIEKVVKKVIFQLHKIGYEHKNLITKNLQISPFYDIMPLIQKDIDKNIKTLLQNHVITSQEAEKIGKTLKILLEKNPIKPFTAIHNDAQWRQILLTKKERLVILDLEEFYIGHPAKDIADLITANKFIAKHLELTENITPKCPTKFLEKINEKIIKTYQNLLKTEKLPWKKRFQKTVNLYMLLRHLHDAAYYAPLTKEKEIFKNFTDFSINMLQETLEKSK
ncbi:MAG: hypothetical protein ACFE68_01375 [Candidatus Hodarchaeota archaeon]